jgi:integrase
MSNGQLNTWVRDVGAYAEISADLRKDWLRQHIEIDPDRDIPQIVDFGTDERGNEIPDIITHDLRASFCTHLMRNDVPRDKAITKTGHKTPDSMNPYISFANDEIDQSEETMYY